MSRRSYKPKNKQNYMTNFYILFIFIHIIIIVAIVCL